MLNKKNKVNQHCHPEFSSGSFKRFRNEFGMTQERGRSMVEMLGVLAVIGVLSIGGISGYTTAMKKHYANDLLNEARKRAVVVAGQIGFNGTNPSLSDFLNNDTGHGTFLPSVEHDTTNAQFTLSITGVAEDVCNQMKNAKVANVRRFEPVTCSGNNNTVKLTFNADMSTTPKASDYTTQAECQSPFKWCSGATTPHCANDCCAGYDAQCCTNTGDISSTDPCTLEGDKVGHCNNGQCEEVTCRTTESSDTSCTSNEGLCPGYYCHATTVRNNGMNFSNGCHPAGQIAELPATIPQKYGKYYIGDTMPWPAAYYYCQAVADQIPGVSGLAPYSTGDTDLEDNNDPYWISFSDNHAPTNEDSEYPSCYGMRLLEGTMKNSSYANGDKTPLCK